MQDQEQAINQLDLNESAPVTSKRGLVPKNIIWYVIGLFVIATLVVGILKPEGSNGNSEQKKGQVKQDLGEAPKPEDLKAVANKQLHDAEVAKNREQDQLQEIERRRILGLPPQDGQQGQSAAGGVRPLPPVPTPLAGNGVGAPPSVDEDSRKDAQALASTMLVFSREEGSSAGLATKPLTGALSGISDLIANARADQARGNEMIDMIKAGQAQAQNMVAGANRTAPRDATPERQFADGQWLASQAALSGREEVTVAKKASSQFLLSQGFGIPAVTISEINTQLPGDLTAQVTENVYDSITGTHLLIPMGTKLIGGYNSDVRTGQSRVLVAFRRLVFPSGAYVDLAGMKGSDAAGNSGFVGDVNNQYIRTFGGSILAAIFTGFLESKMNSNNSSSVNVYTGGSSAQNAAGQVMVDTARRLNDRNTQVQPYIEVPRGYRFRIIVQKDLDLNPAITGVRTN